MVHVLVPKPNGTLQFQEINSPEHVEQLKDKALKINGIVSSEQRHGYNTRASVSGGIQHSLKRTNLGSTGVSPENKKPDNGLYVNSAESAPVFVSN